MTKKELAELFFVGVIPCPNHPISKPEQKEKWPCKIEPLSNRSETGFCIDEKCKPDNEWEKDFESLWEVTTDNNGEKEPFEFERLKDFVKSLLVQAKQDTLAEVEEITGKMKNHNEMLEMDGVKYTEGFEKALDDLLTELNKIK